MSLVIEDGTGKANAESYASVAQLRAAALAIGATVPSKESDCEILLRKAMRLMLRGDDYIGSRAYRVQALDWPRVGVVINRFGYAASELPPQLIDAQCIYAIESQSTNLLPTIQANSQGSVVEQTVGPITTRYAPGAMQNATPIVSAATRVMAPLLRAGASATAVIRN